MLAWNCAEVTQNQNNLRTRNKCKSHYRFNVKVGGTSGGAGGDAGSGATLPVSGSDIPLPVSGSDIPLLGTKPKVAGSRNSEFWSLFANI